MIIRFPVTFFFLSFFVNCENLDFCLQHLTKIQNCLDIPEKKAELMYQQKTIFLQVFFGSESCLN